MGGRVATVLPRLSLACCEGVTLEIGSRTTLTFRKSLCLVVLREVHESACERASPGAST